ncbi:MAG: hypothetical protein ACSNEK_05995 [Parachlamydiaceae bacterium]
MKIRIKQAIAYLDRLERKEIKLTSKEQRVEIAARKRFLSKMRNGNEKEELKRRLIAAEYRLNLTKKEALVNQLNEEILEDASDWKKKQVFSQEQALSSCERKRIERACRYIKFVHLIKANRPLRDRFFKWTIQNRLNPTIFILYPHLANRIRSALLEGRLGTTKALIHDKANRDVLVRTEEGRRFSLLKGSNVIRFKSHDHVTVDKFFRIFQKKNVKEGRLTFLKQGVSNWDPHCFGRRNGKTGETEQIDMQSTGWFHQLAYEEVLTKKEASEKFGHPCDGENWVITIAATRQTEQVTIKGSHAYLKIAVPDDQGNYHCSYGFGLFPKKYPKGVLDVLQSLSCYVPATLEYPDNNHFYSHRETKMCHFPCSKEEGLELMNSIREDFLRAQKNNLPFQFIIDNCTHWIIRKVKKYYPEAEMLFHEQFEDIKASGILGTLVKICKKTPAWFSTAFLYSVSFLLGGWRKKKFIIDGKKEKLSLLNKAPWRNKSFIHPSVIFEKI